MSNDSKIKLHQGAVVTNCYLNKKHQKRGTLYDCTDFEKNTCVQIGEIAFYVDDGLNDLCVDQYPFVRTSLNKIPNNVHLQFVGIIQNDIYPDKEIPRYRENVNVFVSGLIPILNSSRHTIERGDYIVGVYPADGVPQYPPNYHGRHSKDRYVISTTPVQHLDPNPNYMSICVAQSMAPPGKIFYGLVSPSYEYIMDSLTTHYVDAFGGI